MHLLVNELCELTQYFPLKFKENTSVIFGSQHRTFPAAHRKLSHLYRRDTDDICDQQTVSKSVSLYGQIETKLSSAFDKDFPVFIITIIIICSTALGRPWPPQANVARVLYPGHPPHQFLQRSFLPS